MFDHAGNGVERQRQRVRVGNDAEIAVEDGVAAVGDEVAVLDLAQRDSAGAAELARDLLDMAAGGGEAETVGLDRQLEAAEFLPLPCWRR